MPRAGAHRAGLLRAHDPQDRGDCRATGWPLVVYHHGTGGSMRSFISDGVAEQLAARRAPAAVLRLRRGRARRAQGRLDEEVRRPGVQPAEPARRARQLPAGRGRHPAGAARLGGVASTAAASPTGAAIVFDPGAVAFFGHSQGSTSGELALALERRRAGGGVLGRGRVPDGVAARQDDAGQHLRGDGVPDRRAARRRAPGDDPVPELLRPVRSAQLQPADHHAGRPR